MLTLDQAIKAYSQQIKRKQYIPRRVELDIKTGIQIILGLGQTFCPAFEIDSNNRNQLEQMFYYFTGQFEKFDGDPHKGILAVGQKGTGKTMAFVVFQHFLEFLEKTGQLQVDTFSSRFNIVKCTEIKSDFADQETGGMNTLKKYKTRHQNICFDDIGEEVSNGDESLPEKQKMATHYSVQINVLENILTARAELFKVNHTITHGTSNFPIESKSGNKKYFEEFYGDRVADRSKEMFNIIMFNGSSRRK